ncbi:MAG: inositol monophosphatase family protein [Longimicrobiales bacterium]
MNQAVAPSPAALLDLALRAARAAAEFHREQASRVHLRHWDEKGRFDFATEVDREAERLIVAEVRGVFPDHAFLAEEGTVGPALAGGPEPAWTWVIDPLDGTTNYLHRYPSYCASVAVLNQREPIAGAVVAAATGEEWVACRGGGAYRNGEPIRVSDTGELSRALVGTGFPFRVPDRIDEYLGQLRAVLRAASGVRRAGSAALDLCHVACGWFDGFWELELSPWDVAAGTLIVREAGGVVTTLDDAGDVLRVGSVLAGNPRIHELLGGVVRDARE